MNPFQMNQVMMNQMMMNQMGMNQIGINNQQNQFNQLGLDKTTLEVKNIVQPYENKIKELEEIIRQKDLEIAVLKKKINDISSNNIFMNINPIMMNQNMNPMIIPGIFPQQKEDIRKKIYIVLKTDIGDFKNECFENDKVSILFEKNKLNKGLLIYKYKLLDDKLTFEKNGIMKKNSVIYLKNDINDIMRICFKDRLNNPIILNLSKDCPLQLALIYYLIKSDNVEHLSQIIKGNLNTIEFIYNDKHHHFNDTKPISCFFQNGAIISVFYKESFGKA